MRAVVYFGSRNIYPDFETAVKSLLEHTTVDKIYAVIEDDKLPLDLPVECIKIPDDIFNDTNTQTYWTQFGCCRPALSKLLPELDTVLSLDVDTIVEQDISELFDLELGGNYFAAVREPGLSKEKPYFNTGVCLLNLKLWRETGKDDEMIRALNKKRYQYVSQDCMNELCDRVLELPSDYNACFFTAPPTNVKIRHYAAQSDWRNLPNVRKYREVKEMKTLIAVPCMDTVNALFQRSCLAMELAGTVEYSMGISSLIYDSRNRLALKAVEEGFDRILWLDSDMVFEPDLFKRLHKRLDQGCGIITGLYFTRKEPIQPVVHKLVYLRDNGDGTQTPIANPYLDYPKDNVFEVAGCGFGAVMMETAIVKDVADHFGLPFSPLLGFGEDLSFCLRAHELGYKMFCDPDIKLGHVAYTVITETTYLEAKKNEQKRET